MHIEIEWSDLTLCQQDLLRTGFNRHPFTIGTWDEQSIRDAKELADLGLLIDHGLVEPNYRNRQFVVSALGHAFIRASKANSEGL